MLNHACFGAALRLPQAHLKVLGRGCLLVDVEVTVAFEGDSAQKPNTVHLNEDRRHLGGQQPDLFDVRLASIIADGNKVVEVEFSLNKSVTPTGWTTTFVKFTNSYGPDGEPRAEHEQECEGGDYPEGVVDSHDDHETAVDEEEPADDPSGKQVQAGRVVPGDGSHGSLGGAPEHALGVGEIVEHRGSGSISDTVREVASSESPPLLGSDHLVVQKHRALLEPLGRHDLRVDRQR